MKSIVKKYTRMLVIVAVAILLLTYWILQEQKNKGTVDIKEFQINMIIKTVPQDCNEHSVISELDVNRGYFFDENIASFVDDRASSAGGLNFTDPELCISQWREGAISNEQVLRCIDHYMKE